MELVEQKHVYDHTRTELVSVLKFSCGGTLINRCGQEYMYVQCTSSLLIS
jgi:hypothetical protein